MPFGGLLLILEVKYPKTPILGAWIGVFKPNGKILKVSCYRNYCIDFNQIWHTDRDHRVVIMGGPSRRPQIQDGGRLPLKTVKLSYLCDRSADFYEIWHNDAHSPLTVEQPLKFRIFEDSKWRRPQSWRISKIAIYPLRFDRSLRNLVADAKWAS